MKLLSLLSLFPGIVAATNSSIETRDAPIGMGSHSVDYCRMTNYTYEGTLIYGCQNPGTIALTFDDGPQRKRLGMLQWPISPMHRLLAIRPYICLHQTLQRC